MYLGRELFRVLVNFNGVANLNSKEQKDTCQPFMPSTVQLRSEAVSPLDMEWPVSKVTRLLIATL